MDKPTFPIRHRFLFLLTVCILAVLYVAFNVWVFQKSIKDRSLLSAQPPKPSLARPPTPTPAPIAQGKQEFRVSSGNKSGPQIMSLIVDPFDPKVGERQSISVKIKDSTPITSASLTLITDGQTQQTYPLTRLDGTELEGTWGGSWTAAKHDYIYQAQISATSSRGTTTVTPTFR